MDQVAESRLNNRESRAENNFPWRLFVESFGVQIEIETNSIDAIEAIRGLLPFNLADNFNESVEDPKAHLFTYEWAEDGLDSLYENGEWVSVKRHRAELLSILGKRIRLTVAEFADDRVFVHAGVVGIDGKAVVIPGSSFSGKTTLVSELVRKGAVYYSDEYAVFDSDGLVYPFSKPLSMRADGGRDQVDTDVEKFGGKAGTGPLPVGLIVFTIFEANAVWNPEPVNGAQSILELMRDTIPIRRDPQFTLSVLHRATNNAIVIKSKRSEAADTASAILCFLRRSKKSAA